MGDLLSIGASGVRAYQGALTTVSENIAGVGVAGYVRRTLPLKEISASGTSGFGGLGVLAAGVSRQTSEYLQTSVRSSGSDLARTGAASVWLDKIQKSLTGDQLSDRLTTFFASGVSLSAEPSSVALRASMLGAADSAANAFAATGRALDAAMVELDQRAGEAVTNLNSLGQSLQKINLGIARAMPGSAAAAQLADQRDQVLEEMSALTDINVEIDSVGRASVRVGGGGGPVLVDPSGVSEVGVARSGGNLVLAVRRDGVVSNLSPQGGALAGMVEGAERIAGARQNLNDLATRFVDAANTFQANGQDLNGVPGKPMFTVGASPSDVSLALTDGAEIAASSVGGGPRDATNLFALADARTSGGFEAGMNRMVAENAATLNQRNLVAQAQSAIYDGAVVARAEVSGVNLDDEAVDLIRFQQAYQASSRVIQVARETIQSLLDIR